MGLDLSSESMSTFLEMEQIPEVKADPQITRPSVIMRKNSSKVKKEAQPSLSDIMTDCGIFKEFSEDLDDSKASIASPSSIHSEMEQNQELIDELEEFFIKVDGKPTVIDETSEPVSIPAPTSSDKILSALTTGNVVENNNTLTMEDLNNAYTTSLVSEDGQNVIIIIAPSSPSEFDSFLEPVSPKEFKDPLNSPIAANNDTDSSYDTDPDWSPSPASLLKSFHRHNKQSLRRNMLDQNLLNLQQDLTPSKRRNGRKLRTELQLSDTGRRKNLNRT